MSISPPLTGLPIATEDNGFYRGFNRMAALGSKVLIGLLILWAAIWPKAALKVPFDPRISGRSCAGAFRPGDVMPSSVWRRPISATRAVFRRPSGRV